MIHKVAKDIAIPAVGLGTWQMKGDEGTAAVKQALELGYSHIDTAKMYHNENEVGAAIKKSTVNRDDIHLTTKIWHTDLGYDDVHAAIDDSLDRLQTDYVDLLLVHWPTDDTPIKETMRAFTEIQGEGKAKAIGVSNFTSDLLDEALDHAPSIAVNQVEMHVYHQQHELLEYCKENDILLTAYSPLSRGRVADDPLLQEIGEKYDKTAAQVALRWLVQQENVIAIPKAIPEELQQENLDALSFELSEHDMDEISGIEQRPKLIDPGFAPW